MRPTSAIVCYRHCVGHGYKLLCLDKAVCHHFHLADDVQLCAGYVNIWSEVFFFASLLTSMNRRGRETVPRIKFQYFVGGLCLQSFRQQHSQYHLMHRVFDIKISLDKYAFIMLYYRLLCLIQSVKFLLLLYRGVDSGEWTDFARSFCCTQPPKVITFPLRENTGNITLPLKRKVIYAVRGQYGYTTQYPQDIFQYKSWRFTSS